MVYSSTHVSGQNNTIKAQARVHTLAFFLTWEESTFLRCMVWVTKLMFPSMPGRVPSIHHRSWQSSGLWHPPSRIGWPTGRNSLRPPRSPAESRSSHWADRDNEILDDLPPPSLGQRRRRCRPLRYVVRAQWVPSLVSLLLHANQLGAMED